MTPRLVLARAKVLLARPHQWTQGTSAKTRHGELCGVNDPKASALDIYGAIYVQDPPGHVATACIHLLESLADGEDMFRWNDDPERTHADVVQLLNRAIATYEVDYVPMAEEPTHPDALRSVDVARAYEMSWRRP